MLKVIVYQVLLLKQGFPPESLRKGGFNGFLLEIICMPGGGGRAHSGDPSSQHPHPGVRLCCRGETEPGREKRKERRVRGGQTGGKASGEPASQSEGFSGAWTRGQQKQQLLTGPGLGQSCLLSSHQRIAPGWAQPSNFSEVKCSRFSGIR